MKPERSISLTGEEAELARNWLGGMVADHRSTMDPAVLEVLDPLLEKLSGKGLARDIESYSAGVIAGRRKALKEAAEVAFAEAVYQKSQPRGSNKAATANRIVAKIRLLLDRTPAT